MELRPVVGATLAGGMASAIVPSTNLAIGMGVGIAVGMTKERFGTLPALGLAGGATALTGAIWARSERLAHGSGAGTIGWIGAGLVVGLPALIALGAASLLD